MQQESGYVLMVCAMSIIVVMGAAGLAIDLGRMYIAKNEAQAFSDLTSVAAVLELNGTSAGLANAEARVASDANKWNFGHTAFSEPEVLFSTSKDGPWEASGDIADASGYGFARVIASADVPMSFLRAIGVGPTSVVNSRSIAGQVEQTSFREGLFPFSPFAHPPATQTPGANPVSGLTPGESYTLRWGAGAQYQTQHTHCPGDHYTQMLDIARAGGGDERGFIESTSASLIRQTIVYDYQTVFREVGDSVNMTGGAKQTQQDALIARANQDSDKSTSTFAEYFNNGSVLGNGRRIVAAPINTGAPGGYVIVQIGAFFLRPASEYAGATGGNKAFCAEYIGSYVQGGAGTGANNSGYYVVRLVE